MASEDAVPKEKRLVDPTKKAWEHQKPKWDFFTWIKSTKGRTLVQTTSCFVVGAIGFGYVVLHTFCIDEYENFYQFYRKGMPLKVPDKLQRLKYQVLGESGIKERYWKSLHLFMMSGYVEPIFIGSVLFQYGVRVGVPKNYEYEKTKDVEKWDWMIEGNGIPWDSDDGRLFEKSLVLSDRAKKFAIAKCLFAADSFWVPMNCMFTGGAYLTYVFSTAWINQKYQGFKRPWHYRLSVYVAAGTLTYAVYAALRDGYFRRLERKADEKAASLSMDYALGGVEYYSKGIMRNIALRSLFSDGEDLYTPLGNINYKWYQLRQKSEQYTTRKDRMEAMAAKHAKSVESSSDNLT